MYNRQFTIHVALILLLCLITIGLFDNYKKYEFVGVKLIENPDFRQNLSNWEKSQTKGTVTVSDGAVVRLDVTDKNMSVHVRQFIRDVEGYQFLKFSVSLKTEGVLQGVKRWERAHIVVAGVDPSGRIMYQEPHFLISKSGTQDWQHYEKVIKITERIKEIIVSVQISNVEGTVWVKNLSLQAVREKSLYKTYWLLTSMAWIALTSWLVYSYFANYRIGFQQKLILSLICLAGIGVLIPQEITTGFIGILLAMFDKEFDNYVWLVNYDTLDKVEHVGIFLLLSFTVYWNKRTTNELFGGFIALALIALVSEVLQLLTNDRQLEINDLIADILGIISATLLWFLILLVTKIRVRKVNNTLY